MLRLITGRPGPSGFGSATTAEQVTHGIDGSNLTAIVTGFMFNLICIYLIERRSLLMKSLRVTGGASGIGLETARVLAMRNVHVIIAARNMEAADEAKQLILKDNKDARIDILKLDLSKIRSVKAFADNFKELNIPLNILINNAGVMFCPFQLSEDGIEMQLATNHIGHFYLTNLLLDKMKETAKSTGIQGRIMNVSSLFYQVTYKGGIRFDKINDKNSYQDKLAYGQSKLANLLHSNELSRRLQEEGANITVNTVHPGLILTPLMRYTSLSSKILRVFTYFMWKNIPQGAATTCYVALHPSLKGVTGKFFSDCNEHKPNKLALDEAFARKLWDFSNNTIDAALKT